MEGEKFGKICRRIDEIDKRDIPETEKKIGRADDAITRNAYKKAFNLLLDERDELLRSIGREPINDFRHPIEN